MPTDVPKGFSSFAKAILKLQLMVSDGNVPMKCIIRNSKGIAMISKGGISLYTHSVLTVSVGKHIFQGLKTKSSGDGTKHTQTLERTLETTNQNMRLRTPCVEDMSVTRR